MKPNAFIFPTIFLTAQFRTILRIPNTREQKASQSCNHATLMEIEAAIILVKENVNVRIRESGWLLGHIARLSLNGWMVLCTGVSQR